MSRVGKHEVPVPSSVTVSQEGSVYTFKGKLGQHSLAFPECLHIEKGEHGYKITPKDETQGTRALWGTFQRLMSNIVKGVSEGFTVNLDLVGVGYKAAVQGKTLVLQLGYSHDINYDIPEGVTIKCEKPTSIAITASSKQQAGSIAALLRSYRKPEPYKGKGVIRVGEFVVRKEGKKK